VSTIMTETRPLRDRDRAYLHRKQGTDPLMKRIYAGADESAWEEELHDYMAGQLTWERFQAQTDGAESASPRPAATWQAAISFTKLAAILTRTSGETVTRQRVYEWWKRGTKNAAGQPFPCEVRTVAGAPARRPGRHFSYDEVLAWLKPGIPTQYGTGWRQLGQK
jgi:hypothetical protein